jgi:hypothetical protein
MGGPRGSRPDSAARRDTRGRRCWQAGPTGQRRGVPRAAERATRASGLACAARWGRSGRGVGAGRVLGAGREAEAALLGCGAAQGEEGSQLSSGWAVGLTRARSGPSAGLAEREKLGRPGRGKRAGPGERNGPAGERGGLRVGLRRFWVFWVLGFAFSISKLFSS